MTNKRSLSKSISFIVVAALLITGLNATPTKAWWIFGGDSEGQTNQTTNKQPKYVFYFIGDGLSASHRQAAEYYLQTKNDNEDLKLTMNKFPVAGINTTQALDSLVTDSAAAGTALATGHKTNSQVIAQSPKGKKYKTIIEAAEAKGMATGIVTTSRLTHATPATFVSHAKSRYLPNKIANQYLTSDVDFFAGGGYRHFIPQGGLEHNGIELKSKRKDNRNLAKEFHDQGYKVFLSKHSTESFRDFTTERKEKVFAAFTYSHTPYELDRQRTDATPSLSEMTNKGIETLSNYKNGFVMMVEGARIDHASHANDPVGAIHDTLEFDRAIKKAYKFYKKHPNETLIVVAGDHETGGFGLGFSKQYFLKLENLEEAKVTTANTLSGKYKELNKNRAAYFDYIDENLGLDNLTTKEKAIINKAMGIVDSGAEYDAATFGPSYYDAVAIATTHVLSARAGLEWTTYAHSATAVPLTAIGVGAKNFGGYKDNTEVGKAMAELMNFKLTK
ncbi:alkaline phosphatase [Halanaerocella petrolearia]